MEPKQKTFLTPKEYLEIERKAEFKSEYYNGEMFALAGVKENHNIITTNLIVSLSLQLKKNSCRLYHSDMRVRVSETGLYTYPDVVVVCGKTQFEDEEKDTLLNPTLLIEVLSESTEAYDRGKKFEHYRSIPSLHEYILISQDHYKIEKYLRQRDLLVSAMQTVDLKETKQSLFSGWLFSEESKPENSIELTSIRCSLRISEVYDKITF